MAMVPEVCRRSPEIRLISVDLPAPFGPMTAWISPTRTSMDTPDTALRPPKRFSSASARSATSCTAGLSGGRRRGRRGGVPVTDREARELAHAARQREDDEDHDESFDQLP